MHRSVLKGFAICFALNAFSQFTANHTIKTYGVLVFQRAGANVDPHMSSIMLALALIVGALFTTYLADILGRKVLNVISLAGSAFGLFAVATYSYLNVNGHDLSAFDWVPVVSLSFVEFISSAGINALAYVCSVEYLPLKVLKANKTQIIPIKIMDLVINITRIFFQIRTSGYVIIVAWINLATFACTKLFPILLDIVDFYGCMLIFAIGSTLGVLFVMFCMEETNGKSLNDTDEVTNVQRVSVSINL